ncbi:hypothetical protein [Burkholderia glumae]|uniref:hypothetical protein n=1 Tax=Burkholderia glumae TaxID=337 RepID=UPI00214F9921|nr:hypothetical protein [Burkholderia glumae]
MTEGPPTQLGDLWSGKRTLTKDHVLVFVSEDCLREIGMIAAISRAAQAAGATFMYM